ncbi:MAG: ester cyclase [Lewinellaceae bacterium]|nr:ester cyclase [Lewinellaceae bacterium]
MKTVKCLALLMLFSIISAATVLAQSAEQNKAAMMKAYENLNNKDFDGFSTLLADDFTEYAAPEPVKGKGPAMESLKGFMAAFPDMKMEVQKMVAEGNTVMVLISVSGTWKGDMMGMKATGKSFKMIDVDIVEFNDAGKATAHWSVQDQMVMMSQVSN